MINEERMEQAVRQELTAIWNNALVFAASGEGMGLEARSDIAVANILAVCRPALTADRAVYASPVSGFGGRPDDRGLADRVLDAPYRRPADPDNPVDAPGDVLAAWRRWLKRGLIRDWPDWRALIVYQAFCAAWAPSAHVPPCPRCGGHDLHMHDFYDEEEDPVQALAEAQFKLRTVREWAEHAAELPDDMPHVAVARAVMQLAADAVLRILDVTR